MFLDFLTFGKSFCHWLQKQFVDGLGTYLLYCTSQQVTSQMPCLTCICFQKNTTSSEEYFISNDYPTRFSMLSQLDLASSACCMIHELRAPSYCANLGSYIFKNFSFDFFVLWTVRYLIRLQNIPLLNLISAFFEVAFIVVVAITQHKKIQHQLLALSYQLVNKLDGM